MRRVLLALPLALAACGPYAEIAQKLDVTARVAGDTWIASPSSDRTEVRVLIVGTPDEKGTAAFAFTALRVPITRGTSATTLQGRWTEVGTSGTTALLVEHEYFLPDESGKSPLDRRGAYRVDEPRSISLSVTRSAGRLAIAGNAELAGTYVPLGQALGALGTTTPRDAACAFQVANLGIFSSEVRIIGFGGVAMTQYSQAETFVGTIDGSVRVSMSGFTSNTTWIEYSGFEDLGGVVVGGPQITYADSSGDGHMGGVMTLSLTPLAPDGAAGAPVAGTIDYGGAGNPADAIQIGSGNAVGGVYVVTLDGGGTARVAPQTAPSPSVAECLGLP